MAKIVVRWRLPTRDDYDRQGRLAIERAALQAVSGITRDAAKGIGSTGAVLAPYSRRYASLKERSGRKASPPDLTLTGAMLRALRVLRVDTARKAVIGWEGQHVTRDVLAGLPYLASRFRQIETGRVDAARQQGALTQAQSRFLATASRQKKAAAKGRLCAVAYSVLVPALDRRRRFFHVERPERVNAVREVYRRTLQDGVQREAQAPRRRTVIR